MSVRKKASLNKDAQFSLIKYRNLALIRELKGEIPSTEVLHSWSQKQGSDQVAYLLYEAILNSNEQKNFIDFVRAQKSDRLAVGAAKSPIEIWIISSANQSLSSWGSHVDVIGSWLEEIGLAWNELVTLSDNNIMQNAQLIGEALQASHNKKIVISFGRGSLEMSLLSKMNEKNKKYDLHSVCSWINVAGSVSGSRKADQILNSPFLNAQAKFKSIFYREHFKNLLLSSKANPVWRDGSEFSGLKQSINVTLLPICLEKHIPIFYKTSYQKLRDLGPNDSQNLLADQIIRPGFIYPIWGRVVIDDIEPIKPSLVRVILALKCILEKKLGTEFLRDETSLIQTQMVSTSAPGLFQN